MRVVAGLLGAVAVIALLPLVAAPAGGQASELEDARARATEAADAYTAAEVALDEVEVAIARNTDDVAYTQRVYDDVAEAVAAHLVERYIRAGAGAVPLVSDDINVQVRAEALSRLATQQADD